MLKYRHGPVAQRIEQDGSNVKVGGSIPFRVALQFICMVDVAQW